MPRSRRPCAGGASPALCWRLRQTLYPRQSSGFRMRETASLTPADIPGRLSATRQCKAPAAPQHGVPLPDSQYGIVRVALDRLADLQFGRRTMLRIHIVTPTVIEASMTSNPFLPGIGAVGKLIRNPVDSIEILRGAEKPLLRARGSGLERERCPAIPVYSSGSRISRRSPRLPGANAPSPPRE